MKSILIFKCWKFIHCTFISEWDKYWWRRWDWLCWHTFPPQVDSWEMKCCLFIDSPIYPHLRQLIMAAPVILKKTHYRFTLSVWLLLTHSRPSSHWDGNYISAVRSNFFPMIIFISEGYNTFMGALWRVNAKDFWMLSRTNNSLNTVAGKFLWGLHNLRVDYC